ncbi:MAG: TIGR04211 family SH3 domain-containing protein [Gammaproteobacteria bacterium]
MKRIAILAITIACALFAAVRAGADERAFVSEDLYVFLHRGPSSQFKIVGTLTAGTPITVTSRNDDSGYAEVNDGQGKSGWVETRFLSDSVSRRARLEEVERDLKKVQESHAGSGAKLASYEQEVRRLKTDNGKLESKNGLLESEVKRVQNELAAADQDHQMTWFRNGAIVLGVGLLLGLLIPRLSIPRRRNNGW